VVVAASGLAAGSPLAQALTAQYQWEGLGIVDTDGGSVTPIPVANLAQIAGVLNGLAVSRDGGTVWFCTWITNTSGALWSVPVGGGTAAQLCTMPGGPASVSIDNDGTLVMPTLNGNLGTNVFRYDTATTALTPITTTAGPLNCLAVETVTGNWIVATRETGTPARSLFWMTPSGTQTLLQSPNLATITGIDVHPDPEVVAEGTPRTFHYDWQLAPNPGGLPLLGSPFSLTVHSDASASGAALFLLGFRRLNTPLDVLGVQVHVDPAASATRFFWFQDQATLSLPIPNSISLRGLRLYAQTVHDEGGFSLASSSLAALTVL
jgi:hypothetical protein